MGWQEIVAEAPHDPSCASRITWSSPQGIVYFVEDDESKCDCWKSKLKGEDKA